MVLLFPQKLIFRSMYRTLAENPPEYICVNKGRIIILIQKQAIPTLHLSLDVDTCPGTNTPTEVVETPSTFQTSFLETMLGDLGRLSCLEFATEPSPPHSADGFSVAAISPGGFSAARLWKAPLDGPLSRVPREQ